MPIKSKIIPVILLFGVAVFFSFYKLTESPPVWYDEGFYFQTAANLAETGIGGLQLAPEKITPISHLTVGYPLIYPLALLFKIFGISILKARVLMVFFIMSLVLISYLAIKKRYGLNQSLLSIALLVTFPPLYGNGKSVLGEVPGLFWMMFFLWSLEKWKSTASKHKVYAIATGVSAGLCVTTKPIFLLLIPAIVITAVARRHKIPHKLKWVSFAVISFLLPVGFWVFTQFSGNDSLSDILGFYANPYQIKNIAQIIISNLKPFITQIGPFSLLLMMTVWLLALLIRLKKKINIATEELIAIIFSSLIILAFLRTTGSYRYLFPAQIISLLYFPPSLSVVAKIVNEKFARKWDKLFKLLPQIIIVPLFIFGFYQLMFSSWVADAYGSNKTAFWSNYFSNLPPTSRVFFYDTPEIAVYIKNRNYYQYLAPAGGNIGQDQLSVIASDSIDLIIIKTVALESLYLSNDFSGYSIEQRSYKYTILNRVSR